MNLMGTLILVSHDRDFLDGLVTNVFEFGHNECVTLKNSNGFLAMKKMENLVELNEKIKI